MTIRGIKHFDFTSNQGTNITFLEGEIGHSSIKLKITSKPGEGIHSTILFCYAYIDSRSDIRQYHIENYLETSVDIDSDY